MSSKSAASKQGKRPNRRGLPFYLKLPENYSIGKWLGKRLEKKRGNPTPEDLEKTTGVSAAVIRSIEEGRFEVTLGSLYDIVRRVYDTELMSELEHVYDDHKKEAGWSVKFSHDSYYPFFLADKIDDKARSKNFEPKIRGVGKKREPVPLLYGGEKGRYVWALPLRRLKAGPMQVELLELGVRKNTKDDLGSFDAHQHGGYEVIFVVHGKIYITFYTDDGDHYGEPLKTGEFMQFSAKEKHDIANTDERLTALMLVVRTMPNEKDLGQRPISMAMPVA